MNEEKRRQRVVQALDDFLALTGRRRTPERYAILGAALEMKAPFSVEELEQRMSSGGFRVSKATVYNAVALFLDASIVRRVRLDGKEEKWEIADTAAGALRLRLVCSRCGRVREVRDTELARMLSLKRFTSFSPSLFDIYVSGTCTRCRGIGGRRKK